MKVGILTFSAAFNFGAVLQCFALCRTLQAMGHHVQVIDYKPSYLVSYDPRWSVRDWLNRHFSTLLSRRRAYAFWHKIYDGYDRFERDHMPMTAPCHTPSEAEPIISQFDYVVVGSDQVWNPQFNHDDPIWYGKYGHTRWISYAASVGNMPLSDENLAHLVDGINHFSHISVREADLCSALQHGVNKPVDLVVDPSLLVHRSTWDMWSAPIKQHKYILTYQARKSDSVFDIARSLADQLGCDEIIPVDLWDNVAANGLAPFIATPQQFIALVKNASCVVTTSFHGTAFSIVLGTPFYAIKLGDGADGRIENLLGQLGLSHRMVLSSERPPFSKVDFGEAYQRLENLRKKSLVFLSYSLS